MSEERNYVEATPTENPELQSHSTKALVFGILGIAMCAWGVLGMIFSIIGKNCANSYEKLAGELCAKARVGKILSTIGLIISIVMTVIWGLCLLIIFSGIMSAL